LRSGLPAWGCRQPAGLFQFVVYEIFCVFLRRKSMRINCPSVMVFVK
jgi:hypothetical protein